MIANRFEDDVFSKIPCLLYYRGKQPMANGNLFHDLLALDINDETVFQNKDESPKPPAKARKRTVVVVKMMCLMRACKNCMNNKYRVMLASVAVL